MKHKAKKLLIGFLATYLIGAPLFAAEKKAESEKPEKKVMYTHDGFGTHEVPYMSNKKTLGVLGITSLVLGSVATDMIRRHKLNDYNKELEWRNNTSMDEYHNQINKRNNIVSLGYLELGLSTAGAVALLGVLDHYKTHVLLNKKKGVEVSYCPQTNSVVFTRTF